MPCSRMRSSAGPTSASSFFFDVFAAAAAGQRGEHQPRAKHQHVAPLRIRYVVLLTPRTVRRIVPAPSPSLPPTPCGPRAVARYTRRPFVPDLLSRCLQVALPLQPVQDGINGPGAQRVAVPAHLGNDPQTEDRLRGRVVKDMQPNEAAVPVAIRHLETRYRSPIFGAASDPVKRTIGAREDLPPCNASLRCGLPGRGAVKRGDGSRRTAHFALNPPG